MKLGNSPGLRNETLVRSGTLATWVRHMGYAFAICGLLRDDIKAQEPPEPPPIEQEADTPGPQDLELSEEQREEPEVMERIEAKPEEPQMVLEIKAPPDPHKAEIQKLIASLEEGNRAMEAGCITEALGHAQEAMRRCNYLIHETEVVPHIHNARSTRIRFYNLLHQYSQSTDTVEREFGETMHDQLQEDSDTRTPLQVATDEATDHIFMLREVIDNRNKLIPGWKRRLAAVPEGPGKELIGRIVSDLEGQRNQSKFFYIVTASQNAETFMTMHNHKPDLSAIQMAIGWWREAECMAQEMGIDPLVKEAQDNIAKAKELEAEEQKRVELERQKRLKEIQEKFGPVQKRKKSSTPKDRDLTGHTVLG